MVVAALWAADADGGRISICRRKQPKGCHYSELIILYL